MLIMTGHYGALPSTSLSQSLVNYKDEGCGLALNPVYACIVPGYLSVTIEKKNTRQTDTRVVLGVIEYKYIITM